MAHRVDSIGPGKVRVTVDLNDASLDADLDASAARFVTLKNVLVDRPGPLVKRGAMTKPVGQVLAPATLGGFGVYKGPRRAGVSRDINLGVTTGEDLYAEYDGSSSATSLGECSGQNSGGNLAKPDTIRGYVMAEDCLILGGDGPIGKYSGSIIAEHSTGTATMSTGSKTVTLSSALSAQQQLDIIGAFIFNEEDSDATRFSYQVVGVTNSTTITIDRNYAGSRHAAASTFTISAAAKMYKTPGTAGTYADIVCDSVAQAWSRLVLLQPYEPDATGTDVAMKSRIRWSGILGSTEGTAPYTGMHGYHASGYLDLPSQYGDLVTAVPYAESLIIFAKRRLVVLTGQPTFSSAGSLDASTSYPVHTASIRAVATSPYGVFFYDRKDGAMLWDGSGVPRKLASRRVLSLLRSYEPTEVGYYNDHVFFMSSTGALLYSVLADAWSEITGDVAVSFLQPGRDTGTDSTSQYLAGVSSSRYVVNLANVIDAPGVAAADWGDTTITVDAKTGKIGSPLGTLRPYRAWVTYRATDLTTTNPYLALTVNTGLPDTSDSAHTFTCASTDFPETTDVETKRVEINVGGDPMVQVRALQTNAAGKFDLYSLVIDCYDEGEARSS